MSEAPNPPTTPLLLDLITGGWRAQITAAVAHIGVADRIAEGRNTLFALAEVAGAKPDALARLLRAAVGIGLMSERDGVFAMTDVGDGLRGNHPRSLRDMATMVNSPGHWQPWSLLWKAALTGKTTVEETFGTDIWTYYRTHSDEAENFARAMTNMTAIGASEVSSVFDPSPYALIVDVGGSQGSLLAALLERAPEAKGVIFDLEHVRGGAEAAIAARGLAGRVRFDGGNFFSAVTPDGDLYVLKFILHDWPDEDCVRILQSIRKAAKPTSRLIVVEMLVPERPSDSFVNLLDLNMMVLVGGRERTAAEYQDLLRRAGFVLETVKQTPGLNAVLEARIA